MHSDKVFVAVTVTVLAWAILDAHCALVKEIDLERNVGACGISSIQPFNSRADALVNEFPWNAQLFYTHENGQRDKPSACADTLTIGEDPRRSHSFCEGVLISPNYVLTTTICLSTTASSNGSVTLSFVRLGKWDGDASSVIDVPVAKFIQHNQFDAITGHNDIGLVKLQSNVVYTDSVRPICLPPSEIVHRKSYETEELIASGWGQTETEKCARIKQKVKLRAVTSETCEQKYKFYGNEQVINHGRVCAGGDEAYDTCAGYAGAPLATLDKSTNHWTLVGLGSLGPICKGTGTPGIYTRVGTYIDWITENVESRNIVISF